ncbi:MAG: DUF3131 domain-containing protein, partial [Nodosilinea sp.]
QLWGFDASRSDFSDRYQTQTLEGQAVPVSPPAASAPEQYTTATPLVLYGLEFGLEPQARSRLEPMFQAEANRHQRTGTLSASGTALISSAPYVVHSPLVANGEPWPALTDSGETTPQRIVSTGVAYGYAALFPDHPYSQTLVEAVGDRVDPEQGYYEGIYEGDRQSAQGFTNGTNSLVLQAILYRRISAVPLVQPSSHPASPWWQAIRSGSALNRGLPGSAAPQISLVTATPPYWTTASGASTAPAAPIHRPRR